MTKFGALDNLKVPRVREGDFKPKILLLLLSCKH
ncbi:hypothetical protein [Thermodesulfobacterium commune]